jgi:hypothetical protein
MVYYRVMLCEFGIRAGIFKPLKGLNTLPLLAMKGAACSNQ